VTITSRFRPLPLRALIRRALRHAAAVEGLPPGVAVGVLVCDDAEIAGLNRDYADEDRATDVLSFPGSETRPTAGFRFAPGAERELGDIVLSLDHVRAQAGAAGHSVEKEAATLVVHGFLHLLGYDHATAADERRMFGRTAEIVGALDV
jgi:probable rRNA maturation factor